MFSIPPVGSYESDPFIPILYPKKPTYGVAIPGRNDDYGKNLLQRARYSLNSMLTNLDEVIYVDWNTPDDKPSLAEEILGDLVHLEKFKWIRVSESQARQWTNNDPLAQACVEVLARNIGLRRLSTDYLISSNIDIICPPRELLEEVVQPDTMIVLAERSINPFELWTFGGPKDYEQYYLELALRLKDHPQKPPISVCEGDTCSLISSCGDFQIMPRELVYRIRGFEESLTGRGFADSNIQRKAQMAGYRVEVNRTIPMWHIGHEGGQGGVGRMNDMQTAIFMTETSNPETWGFSNEGLGIWKSS